MSGGLSLLASSWWSRHKKFWDWPNLWSFLIDLWWRLHRHQALQEADYDEGLQGSSKSGGFTIHAALIVIDGPNFSVLPKKMHIMTNSDEPTNHNLYNFHSGDPQSASWHRSQRSAPQRMPAALDTKVTRSHCCCGTPREGDTGVPPPQKELSCTLLGPGLPAHLPTRCTT